MSIKRFSSKYHLEKQNTYSPHVSWWSPVLLFIYNFWCHVAWSTTSYMHFLNLLAAKSKVNYFRFIHLAFKVNNYILRFYISMSNIFIMEPFKASNNLIENFENKFFWQPPPISLFQFLVKNMAFTIFQNK
jgi:hypothetical protein